MSKEKVIKNMQSPLSRFSSDIIAVPRIVKTLIVFSSDICICIFTVWLAYFLRLGHFVAISHDAMIATIVSIVIVLPIFIIRGLYREIFRYSGWPTLLSVARAVVIYAALYVLIFTIIGVAGVPRTIGIIQPILLLLIVGLSRALASFLLGGNYNLLLENANRRKVLIYGAGDAGRQLASVLINSIEMQVVGFLDDDKQLHGRFLNGFLIHDPRNLPSLVNTQAVTDVLMAMPSASRKRRSQILGQIQDGQVTVRTLPSVSDLVQGKVTISDLRELDIDDLLGREAVAPNQTLLTKNIFGKIVMVTGAGGSIGSELCRQIDKLGPQKIVLVEQSEFALYAIQQELESRENDVDMISLLGSVQDKGRMNEIMATWQPHTVYHAAAYKHVPLVEHNLIEGVKNNVFGTLITARAAVAQKVENFVLVSTDKAVRPTNAMGASKRLAEIMLQALAADNPLTKLSIVRFGNVLGSSGSVVPKFRKQIKDGGPVTITHPEITRFFMTISEASQLVIQAGAMAKGGDVFVLNMGEPVKIIDLARRMINLSGLSLKDEENPDGDIEFEITNLRPGEKLYEELLLENNPELTSHSHIMKANEPFITWEKLEPDLNNLTIALNANDVKFIRKLLRRLVLDYQPNRDIVDWVYVAQHGKNMKCN
ncbi:nucleoside-diphosphate sugar epimerase/dehydratase [Alphaproteobacteria bacterium]|nr:nucleoside-diphosphate sugar epimerase/dehydratase [Alphaproteobacteria bacterium]